jgi:hypothetical protein
MATRSLMEKPMRYEPTPEPLDEEERRLMDPESWDWDSTETGVTVGEPGTMFTMEFSRDEHRLLARAARENGLTTHAYIKRAAIAAANLEVAGNSRSVRTPHAATG